MFCMNCGAKLPEPAPVENPAPITPAPSAEAPVPKQYQSLFQKLHQQLNLQPTLQLLHLQSIPLL